VSASSESTPSTLTLTADPSKVPAGTYLAQVAISAGSLGTYVDVYFRAGSSTAGNLAANPTGIAFVGQPGVNVLPAQTLSVFDRRGAGPGFSAFATSTGNWLSISPSAGNTPGTLSVIAVQAGLPAGTFNGTVTLKPADGGTPTVIPITLLASGSGAATVISLSQTALTFNHQVGTTAPAVQIVGVFSSVGYSNVSASTTTSWLRLTSVFNPTPASTVQTQTPGEFNVLVDPTGLTPGTYVGSVIVSSSGAQPKELPVSLTVTPDATLNANPSSVFFRNFDPIYGPGSSNVTIAATGAASLSFIVTLTPVSSWLSVSPLTGSTANGFHQLTVTGDPTGLASGVYNGVVTLTIQGTGATLKIPVVMEVTGSSGTRSVVIPTNYVELSSLVGLADASTTLDLGSNPAGTTHEFTASASSANGWLLVSPFSGTAPGKLTISANSAAVPGPGSYDGEITITSLITGQQDTISVRFNLALRTITAEPASLTFTQQQRGVPPPAQTIQVRANSQSTYTVTTQPNWVRANPTGGTTPSNVVISVDPTGLAPGTHSGSVRIIGANNQVNIPVSLVIPEPPAPTATPASLAFTYQTGSPAPQPLSVNVSSTGDQVSFGATAKTESGINWLGVTSSSSMTPAVVTASVNPALLVPGQHSGTITLTASDPTARPGVVAVTVNVSNTSAGVQALLHGAALAPTTVAPGLIVTLTGTGLGPATGVAASPTAAGAFETRLADTRVLFDGVPAPLLYVRNDQINAIAPYALYGRFNTRIQVESGTNYSLPIEVRVVDSAPGIFTSGSSGRGQAAALNQDYTINSAANPAARGSIISIFGTGEGQTDPKGQDGRVIVTDLRRPLLPVTATIAGRPAEVTYIGSAPTLVSGVFQANIRIPADVEAGALPLEIQIGGVATQSAVTIAVK
jgi:uncharacterized protein (TIGR03437 family)